MPDITVDSRTRRSDRDDQIMDVHPSASLSVAHTFEDRER